MSSDASLNDATATRVSQLVTAEFDHAVERDDFGVIVQDVKPLDLAGLISSIAQPRFTRQQKLRVCLVDAPEDVRRAHARYASLLELLTFEEETAVGWRNKRLRTIAVVTSRPLAKAASLREFRVIDERDLAKRLCSEQREKAEVTWLRTLWDALKPTRNTRVPLESIVRFALTLDGLPPADRSSHAPKHLHILGLFSDSLLADERSEQRLVRRLTQNRELVEQVRRASDEDWVRVRHYQRSLAGQAKASATRLTRRLRELASGGPLEGIDFPEAFVLWRGKAKTNGDSPNGGAAPVEVERVVARKLLQNDLAPLRDIAEEFKQIVQVALDDDSGGGLQDIKQASNGEERSVVEVNRGLLQLVRAHSTEAEWGAVIEVASEKPGTLTEVTAFKGWTPFDTKQIVADVQSFVDEGIAPASVLALIRRITELRGHLVPYAPQLALSPVTVLAGEPELLEAAERYLAAYEQLLRQLHGAYHEMHAAADLEAERVLGLMLCLELYIYKKEGQYEALMSPIHPLFLWRSITLVREVRGLGAELSQHEAETVEAACADKLQGLQVLVVPRQATGSDQAVMLGQAGTIGCLPVFKEAPRGMLEPDGVRTVAELAQTLARLRPFVRPGLQVMLVNLPRPARFVEQLVDRLDLENSGSSEAFWGLHIRIRYTHPDTAGWANEIEAMDDDLRERLTAGEESSLLTVSVKGEIMSWEALQQELKEYPAHLSVVVDPFEVRTALVARAQMHTMSPWMPTSEYRFNRIRKELQVIPVAEEHVFGSYLAAASLVHTALQRKTPAHLPQVREVKDVLDGIAQHSTWTVVADPHRVPLARLGGAEVIDRRVEKGRQLTCFAHDLAPFVRRLDEQLRRTHFLAEPETLQTLIRDLVALEPNGILGLASSSHEKQIKGSLGKLIAVRWYRSQQPTGLAVSLDTENAARWLVAGHHSREKADLLGLREEEGALVFDVIEVKAHDEATPYTVSEGRIAGHAVDQVLATMHALAEVFSPDARSPLAKPRREVLREHLYIALLRDQEPDYVDRWHALLQDVFDGKVPVRLVGRIVHVQLASVAMKESRLYLSATGVPVRVDTLSAEDVGIVLRSSRSSPANRLSTEPSVNVEERLEPADALARLLRRDVEAPNPLPARDMRGGERRPSGQDNFGVPTVVSQPESVGAEETVPESAPLEVPPGVVLDIALGTERSSSNNVRWLPSKQSNGFFLILGASGSGKTETLKVLGSSISDAGVPVLVLDFHGDVVLPGVETILLSSGSASIVGLNPMELDIHSAGESGLYDQRAALRGMIQRAVPALGHRQSSLLREAFDEAYRRAGIVDDDPKTWSRRPPTFFDVQNVLAGWADDDDHKKQRAGIEGCLAAIRELFDHPIFRRAEHISVDDMLSRSVRLDLSKLPDQVRFIATETLLRRIFRVLRLKGPIPVNPTDDRQRFRLFVVIDEAKILSLGGGERDRADNILNELITESRKFGLGMILASQMSEHFSEEVRANAATWLVLKPMDIREAKKNAPNVSVDPEDLIQLSGRGDGYFRDRPSSRARRIQVRLMNSAS